MPRDHDDKSRGNSTKKKDKKIVTLLTPPFRMAFPHLFEAEETDNGERYSVTALFPPDANLKPIKNALYDCMEDAFGEDEGDWPTGRNDIHPDDKIEKIGPKTKKYDGYKDGWFKMKFSTTEAPGIVDAEGEDVISKREVYGGRWARAQVNVTSYDNKSKGVTAYLNHIQLLENDTPFGGRGSASDAFDKYELKDRRRDDDDEEDERSRSRRGRDRGDESRDRGRGRDDDSGVRDRRGGAGRDDAERPSRGRERDRDRDDDERPSRARDNPRSRKDDTEDERPSRRNRDQDDDERPSRCNRDQDDERPSRSRRDRDDDKEWN